MLATAAAMEEMHQSVRIIQQCIDQLPPGPIIGEDAPDLVMPLKAPTRIEASAAAYGSGLIKVIRDKTFRYISGDVYGHRDVPKGELGFYFISDGTQSSLPHAHPLPFLHPHRRAQGAVQQELIADLIANIGSLDVVLGESDR